jgi:hypothetical protein
LLAAWLTASSMVHHRFPSLRSVKRGREQRVPRLHGAGARARARRGGAGQAASTEPPASEAMHAGGTRGERGRRTCATPLSGGCSGAPRSRAQSRGRGG